MSIILASKSAARRAVLDGAGVPYEAMVAGVDEDAVKASLLAEGCGPREVADALAELKAIRVSAGREGFVIGADQTLDLDGRLYERHGWPMIDVTRRSVEETAAAVLNLLSGGHGQVEVLG